MNADVPRPAPLFQRERLFVEHPNFVTSLIAYVQFACFRAHRNPRQEDVRVVGRPLDGSSVSNAVAVSIL